MDDDRAPVGLLISALAAVVLALSVFAPWYGVTVTASGAAAAQTELATAAKEYGNANLQRQANILKAEFGSIVGRQVATVTARQATKRESLILLVLAGVALLASLFRLANMRGLLFATGSQIALLGGLAFAVVFWRVLVRPGAAVDLIALSPSWGIWLALLSAAGIAGGGLIAGSDRASTRLSTKHGPGPPPLGAPPSVRALSQGSPLHPPSRRR